MSASHTATGSSRWLSAVVLAAAVFITLPRESYVATQRVSTYRLLDRSWECGVVRLLGEGQWLGRDRGFPYGPLYQVIHSCGGALAVADAATILRWHHAPQTVLSVLAVWWVFGLAGVRSGVRCLLFTLWVVLVAAPLEYEAASLKPVLALPIVAGCTALLGRLRQLPLTPNRTLALFLAWAVPCPVAALYSFDLGLFSGAALSLLTLIVAGLELHQRRTTIIPWVAMAGLATGAVGFVILFRLLPGWEHYLGETWQLAALYTSAMAEPAGDAELLALAGLSLGSIAALVWAASEVQRAGDRAPNALVLAGLAALSLVTVRYAVTRSDFLHFYRALVPGVLLVGCLIPGYLAARSPSERVQPAWYWAGTCAALGPFALLSTTWLTWQMRLVALSALTLSPAAIDYADSSMAAAVEMARARPERSLVVWPYGTLLAQMAGKSNPLYTVQSADLAVGLLDQRTVEQLARDMSAVLIYRNALAIGAVPPYARNPRLFRRLLENYELAAPLTPEFALLRRRTESTPRWTEAPVTLPAGARFEPRPNVVLKLPLPPDVMRASDFLSLRLRIEPAAGLSLKPGRLIALLGLRADKPVVCPLLLFADGASYETLVGALNLSDDMLLSAWGRRPWRATESVTDLGLVWQPLDRLSQPPREIIVEHCAILRPAFGTPVESSRAAEARPDLREAVFGEPPPVPSSSIPAERK